MQIQRALEGLGSKIAYNSHERNERGALVAVELLCQVAGCGYTCGYTGPRLYGRPEMTGSLKAAHL